MWDALDDFYWTYQSLIHGIGVNGILALSVYVVLAVGQLSSARPPSWVSALIPAPFSR